MFFFNLSVWSLHSKAELIQKDFLVMIRSLASNFKRFILHRTTFSHSRSKQIWKQNTNVFSLIIKLISDDCTNQGKIFCQQLVKCADGSDDYDVSGNRKGVGCQRRKFVCLNNSVICDGNFDCMPYDDTDEINCKLSPSIRAGAPRRICARQGPIF